MIFIKKCAFIITAAILAFIAFGCAGEPPASEENPVVGQWRLYSVIIDNSEYIGEAADESLPGASECVLTVTADGNFDFSIAGADVVGTYATADGSITFYEDNSEFPVTIDGDRLTMDLTEYSGMDMKYVFVRE